MERNRTRRPWIIGAGLSLMLGFSVATVAALEALSQRDEARKAAGLAQSVNNFLTQDLLGRGNPAESGKPDETLMDAATASEAAIDRRLGHEPLAAGAIYLALAKTFDSRSAPDAARHAYREAIDDFTKAGPPGKADALIATLEQSVMETTSGQLGALERARALIADAAPRVAAMTVRRTEGEIWLLTAQADLQWLGGDADASERQFARAAALADTLPGVFDEASRLKLRRYQAYALLRLGEWTQAEALLQTLLMRERAVFGPHHPDTLRVEFNMTRLLIAEGDVAAALEARSRLLPEFVAVFGSDHRATLQLRTARAQSLAALRRYDEAADEDRRIYDITRTRYGDRSAAALSALTDEATVLCQAGHVDTGLTASQAAYEGAVAAFGATTPMARGIGVDLAFCLIQAGRYQQALPHLDGNDWAAVGQLMMDPDYAAEIDVMKAAIALSTGKPITGKTLLHRVGQVFERPGAEPYMRQWVDKLNALAETPVPTTSGTEVSK